MKLVVIAFFVFISNFLFSQTEQISLDFFSKKIVPQIKNSIIFYDKKIIKKEEYERNKINDDEETILEIILWDYSMCKNDSRGISNTEFDFKKNFKIKEIMEFANVKNSNTINLTVPNGIKFRKELKTKKRKAGKLRYKINKLFAQKYNLKISPSIQIEKDTYLTRIFMTRQNQEHGRNFDIVVKNGKVIDWCENQWIQ